MRKNIGLFILAAMALSTLGGCDDSHRSKQTVKTETRKSAANMASAYRVGAGWQATAETEISVWNFKHGPDTVASDSLNAIRTALEANMLPPRDSVQIADIVNRLLPADAANAQPLSEGEAHNSQIILVTTPWNDDTLLLWIEISGVSPTGGAKIDIAFNPEAVAAFRPLGDPSALPVLDSAASNGQSPQNVAMLYELMPQPNFIKKSAPRLAVLRIEGDSQDRREADRIERIITTADMADNLDEAPEILRFAAAVAGFGGLLRGDPAVRDLSCGDVIALAQSADRPDPDGRRTRIIRLMQRAEPLIELPSGDPSPGESAR